MVYRTPYPWHIKPPAYSMLFETPNPWYIEPPTHGISNHLPWFVVTKSYKDDHFAKTKSALKVQI
jgi:hypothetical protein